MAVLVVSCPVLLTPASPNNTMKAQESYRAMIDHSNTRKVSPSQQRAMIAVIIGPMFAKRLMTRREMYFVLAVLIMFDHELCNERNSSALLCCPLTSS